MRLSTQQIFQGGLNGVLNGQSRLLELQQQIATGKKFETPADNPIASAQVLAVDQQLALSEQYQSNSAVAQSKLSQEESILDSMQEALQRVRQLTVQAGDGALSPEDRKALAVELRQRLDQLVNYANARDSNDQYLFGGFQSGQAPIVKGNAGGYQYQGDEGQLFIKVSESVDVAVSDSGKRLFMDIPEPKNFSAAPNGANTGTLAVTSQAVIHQNTFDAFHPDGATITFDTTGPTPTYTVTRVSDGGVISAGTPSAPLLNVPFVAGTAIEFEGLHIQLSGAPANGDTIDVTSVAAGKLDMFSAIEKLVVGLEGGVGAPANPVELGELVADSLLSLDGALENILNTQAQIGGRMNVIEDAAELNDQKSLINQQVRSDLQDLDYADALSKLSLQSFILEATQSSFVKISNLSLFNFLR